VTLTLTEYADAVRRKKDKGKDEISGPATALVRALYVRSVSMPGGLTADLLAELTGIGRRQVVVAANRLVALGLAERLIEGATVRWRLRAEEQCGDD
jgi:hypothetical protein